MSPSFLQSPILHHPDQTPIVLRSLPRPSVKTLPFKTQWIGPCEYLYALIPDAVIISPIITQVASNRAISDSSLCPWWKWGKHLAYFFQGFLGCCFSVLAMASLLSANVVDWSQQSQCPIIHWTASHIQHRWRGQFTWGFSLNGNLAYDFMPYPYQVT